MTICNAMSGQLNNPKLKNAKVKILLVLSCFVSCADHVVDGSSCGKHQIWQTCMYKALTFQHSMMIVVPNAIADLCGAQVIRYFPPMAGHATM